MQTPVVKGEKGCNLSSSVTISRGRSKNVHLFSLPFSWNLQHFPSEIHHLLRFVPLFCNLSFTLIQINIDTYKYRYIYRKFKFLEGKGHCFVLYMYPSALENSSHVVRCVLNKYIFLKITQLHLWPNQEIHIINKLIDQWVFW